MDPAALQVLHHVLEARKQGSTDTVSLPGADLRGAQLMRADLVGCDLSGAGLDHAQLAGAKLIHANLQMALLCHTDLAGADLTEADLRNADLSHARVEGASLAGADLRGARVEGVVGQPASIAGAKIDRAMAERSGIADADVIQLWRAGAVIDDIEAFESALIRNATIDGEDLISDVGPPPRVVDTIEVSARAERAKEDESVPPSARISVPQMRAVMEGTAHKLSIRSMKLVSPVITSEMAAAPAWKAGDRVMGVVLKKEIGGGNVGIVWLAEDDDGQEVAVKVFKTSRANLGLLLPAFRRGVTVMNRITGTEGVIGLRCVSLNKLGFVMDMAANGSAADLPALQWSTKNIVEWFRKLCATVERAHAAGALHRCIKPRNILLDADLEPMLSDFDMVDLPTAAAEFAQAGGYAPYAAPEELLGHGTQSPTADVYSLGRVLHFLLLGSDPKNRIEGVPALDELAQHPTGLVRIIRKCTVRAPEGRYQWVSEVLADLARYEDSEQVGLAGGIEESFLPYRVSSLGHKTPWLGRSQAPKAPSMRPKPSAPPPRPAQTRTRPPRAPNQPTADNPLGVSRNTEKVLGTIGAFMVLASLLVIALASADPSEAQLIRMQYLSVVGGGMMSLLLSRAESNARLWRLLWIAVALIGFYFANLPGLFA